MSDAKRALTQARRPFSIAILAMGGEGGGVLADWIVDVAEHAGFAAQATSVPGVAQRTGTTLYYVEFDPRTEAERAGAEPVLALMPVPGDVDVVIASELMEMGRALQRGLVTAGKTTLIASTHRVYSMTEKTAMGDGRVDSKPFVEAARAAALRFVHADFAARAERTGSVISAALFGALAGSGALPFARAAFEEAIRRAGVGVEGSLRAFADGYDVAQRGAAAPDQEGAAAAGAVPLPDVPQLAAVDAEIARAWPAALQPTLRAAVRRLTDYQDRRYAQDYLQRLRPFADAARAGARDATPLLAEVARYLALWMTYEDVPRVAELKIRGERFARVTAEVRVRDGQLLAINEYFHPRVEELADSLPATLGRRLMKDGWLHRAAARQTRNGRIVRTTSLRGFLLLLGVASLRRWRRRSLRFEREHAHIDRWLERVARYAGRDPALAIEFARCQRLVKGYGDTHARGMANLATIVAALDAMEDRPDAAARTAAMREAALADEHGQQLAALIAGWGTVQPAREPEAVAAGG